MNCIHKGLRTEIGRKLLWFMALCPSPVDIAALTALMNAAIGELLTPFLAPAEVTASFSVMGLDTTLIEDGTYFVIESDGTLVGCGGWSARATLFGGDHCAGRNAAKLDPQVDAGRESGRCTPIRPVSAKAWAAYSHALRGCCPAGGLCPGRTGRDLGGRPLYRACGYEQIVRLAASTPSGVRVPLIRMAKPIR